MIRALVLIAALFLGLAAALTVGGRMSHLRLGFEDTLPGWTQGIADDAGVLSGGGHVSAVQVRWRMTGVGFDGPRWGVFLSGSDWQATGQASLHGAVLRIEAISGSVPGSLVGAEGALTGDLALNWADGAWSAVNP